MFCPRCQDEFRPGFTRCAACGVDLVERLPAAGAAPGVGRITVHEAVPAGRAVPTDYCGFLSLDEARRARDTLRGAGIEADILIRHAPDGHGEEYWLRADQRRIRQVVELLGYEPADTADEEDDSFRCSDCGASVPAEASVCSRCGARFEDG